MNRMSPADVKNIVAMVGREGATSALAHSKRVGSEDLSQLATLLGLKVNSRVTKAQIATQIVRYLDRRITKALDELKRMSKEDIIKYLEEVDCDQEEIGELLSNIDLRKIPSRTKSRRAMIEFAAIQISSLGIFERLADRST